MYYGYLEKKKKDKLGKMTYEVKWFFIISTKSLNLTYRDEILLNQSDICPNIELDNLYFYKVSGNNLILKTVK